MCSEKINFKFTDEIKIFFQSKIWVDTKQKNIFMP